MAGKEGAPKPTLKDIEKASQTRLESQDRRESPEEREKHEALQYLKKVGFLRSVNDEEMLHGRGTPTDGSPLVIDSEHDNGGNKGGNGQNDKHSNWNKVPAFSTGNRFVAGEYAKVRSGGDKSKEEIYRITSNDPEASILDLHYNPKTKEEAKKVNEALKKLTLPVTEASPFIFEDRGKMSFSKFKERISAFAKKHSGFFDRIVPKTDIPRLSAAIGSDSMTRHVVAAANSKKALKNYKTAERLAGKLLKGEMDFDGASYDMEYITSWMRNAHIVGVREYLTSPRVKDKNGDRVPFHNNFMLDLERINIQEKNERARKARMMFFGHLALKAGRLSADNPESRSPKAERSNVVGRLERDPFVTPEETIELAKKVPGYKDIFESDSGVWEKLTLEEHTGTLLRLLDENFADRIPARLLPVTRMAILTHDIGKTEAAKLPEYKSGTREERDLIQSAYNESYAMDFLEKAGVSPKNQELILGIIGQGKELMAAARVIPGISPEKRKQASNDLDAFCLKLSKDCLGGGKEEALGIRQLCYIVQMCDSAAYTTMAKTRDAKSGIFYRNSPKSSFNKTFASSVNIFNGGGRRMRLASEV